MTQTLERPLAGVTCVAPAVVRTRWLIRGCRRCGGALAVLRDGHLLHARCVWRAMSDQQQSDWLRGEDA